MPNNGERNLQDTFPKHLCWVMEDAKINLHAFREW